MRIMINIYTTVSNVVILHRFSSRHLHPFTPAISDNVDRSQRNQRVQEIHHNINTSVLRDVLIDISVHEENSNTHEAEDYNGQYGIKQKWNAQTFS